MATTIVLGYEGSDCAKAAVEATANIARHIPDVHVLVVYAYEFSIGYVPTGLADSPLMMSAEYDSTVGQIKDFGKSRAKEAVDMLRAAGVPGEPLLMEDRPVDALLAAAKEHDAVMIVVGTHGEGGMRGALLGSTALKLVHHSDRPVLVVPHHKKK